MTGNSFLVPITGSQESLYAAEFAWHLAKRSNAGVTGQHVVDIRGAFEFVGVEQAGLIGSGPYLACYEAICNSLREVAEKIEDSYSARVSSLGIDHAFVIDEGDPAEEICNRSLKHDFIVVGHRSRNAFVKADCQVVKLSLAELLAHRSPVPLFILQKPIQNVSEFVIFCSMDHINRNWLNSCRSSARALGASCSWIFLASGQNEQPPLDFIHDLQKTDPAFEYDNVRIVSATSDGRSAQICCHHTRGGAACNDERLIVLPTLDSGDHRVTLSGECPTSFLRRISFGAMVFWPEECSKPLLKEEDGLMEAC